MKPSGATPAQGPLYWSVVVVVALVMMALTSPWWSGPEMWKTAVAGGVSGLSGSVAGRWVMARRARKG